MDLAINCIEDQASFAFRVANRRSADFGFTSVPTVPGPPLPRYPPPSVIERIDHPLYLRLVVAFVRGWVGVFRRQVVINEVDDWTLLCGGNLGTGMRSYTASLENYVAGGASTRCARK